MANDIVYNVVANSQTFVSGVREAANAAKQFQDNLAKAEKQEEQNRARLLERIRDLNRRHHDQALADARSHIENMKRVWSSLSGEERGIRPYSRNSDGKNRRIDFSPVFPEEHPRRTSAPWREAEWDQQRVNLIAARQRELAVEEEFIQHRESLLKIAEAKESANRQRNLERLGAMRLEARKRELAEEQRNIERNEQTAANVRRSLMTPRDFVTQDILAAKAAWKSGELDAKHYFDFVALQKQRLLQMNADAKLGYTGYGGRGARVTQQLAFGLEDFATQYGTMGMIGGLRAASNNISAAGMMFSAPVGIAASLASTLTMLGIAAWESSKKLQEHKKSLKDLEQEYNSLEKIVERSQKYFDFERDLSRASKMKSSGDVSSRVSDLEHERKKIEDEISKRRELAARLIDESIAVKVKAKQIEMNQSLNLGSATDENGYTNLEQLQKNRQAFLEEIDKLQELQRKTIEEKAKLDASIVTDPKQSETFRKQQLELEELNVSLERNIRLRQEMDQQFVKSTIEENEKRIAEIQSKRFKDESEHLESIMELREKEQKQIEEFRRKHQSPKDKYKEEMERIAEMRTIGLDDATARKAEKDAAAELRQSLGSSRIENATDARGANARSGFEAALRSYMQTVPKSQTSPPPTQAEKEQIDLLKNSYKQLQELGNVLKSKLTSENLGLVMEVLNF